MERLTPTGTVRISFRVTDDEPFVFLPGQFVGIEEELGGLGFRRRPYCIFSPPTKERTFQLLIRILRDGPLSRHLGSLREGDVVRFRGPTGRTMMPKQPGMALVGLVTGVGVASFYSLARHLLSQGFDGPIRLYWGLRLVEDICLIDELEALGRSAGDFRYRISLSSPPLEGWTGLRGRITESVPPLLPVLGGQQFYLSGNGAMVEEVSAALSDLGVSRVHIYEERYFNFKYRPAPERVAAIRERFVAGDLTSPFALLRDASEASATQGLAGRRVAS